MSKAPGFWFFTGDWLKDPELRFCSIFARGLLVDLLCYMFEAKEQGYMCTPSGKAMTNEQIVDAISGGSREEKLAALQELEENGVLSRDSRGVLYSRRLSRLKELTAKRRESGSKGGSKTQAKRKQHAKQKVKQNQGVTVSDSDSDSDSVSDSDTDSEEELFHNSCSESQATSEQETDFVEFQFPVTGNGGKPWNLTASYLRELEETFETIDVRCQIKMALAWVKTKPKNRKTPLGMKTFLFGWLSRAVNNSRGSPTPDSRIDQRQAQADSFLRSLSS
jgi:hypothetical protein